MSRIEFEELMELSRKSTTEKPRSELVVLALGINGITAKVKSEHNSGWFSLNVEEFEEIIPKLMSRNLLQVEEANYVIPTKRDASG